MERFYTDPSGHIYALKQIFPNYGELWKDIHQENQANSSWNSPIAIGDYVIVSYGSRIQPAYVPSGTHYFDENGSEAGTTTDEVKVVDTVAIEGQTYGVIVLNNVNYYVQAKDIEYKQSEYEQNASIDLHATAYEKRNYNACVFQKTYIASASDNNSGVFTYKPVVNYSGATPQIELQYEHANPSDPPSVELITTGQYSPEKPLIILHLPSAVPVSVDETVNRPGAGSLPNVQNVAEDTANEVKLQFTLPKAQRVVVGDVTTGTPSSKVIITPTEIAEEGGTIGDKVKLDFAIPGSKPVKLDEDGITILPAGSPPALEDQGDDDESILHFSLPKAQTITLEETQAENVGTDPFITESYDENEENEDDIDRKHWKFHLPKSKIIHINPNIDLRDFGTNAEITEPEEHTNETTLTFHLPKVKTTSFKSEIVKENHNALATVEKVDGESTVNEDVLQFHLPRAQTVELSNTSLISPALAPELTSSYSDGDNELRLSAKLPVAEILRNLTVSLDNPVTPRVDKSELQLDADQSDSNQFKGIARNRDLTFHLPKGKTFRDLNSEDISYASADSGEDPTITVIPDGSDANYDYSKFKFKLPKALDKDVVITPVSRNSADLWKATISDTVGSNKAKLGLKVPQEITWSASQEWSEPGATPQVTIGYKNDNNNNPNLDTRDFHFILPKQQVIEVTPQIQMINPEGENATVDVVETPVGDGGLKETLTFKIPRAGRFFIGNSETLGKWNIDAGDSTEGILANVSNDIKPGDWYIHSVTSKIWYAKEYTDRGAAIIRYIYVGCMAAPSFAVSTNPIDPFVQNTDGTWLQAGASTTPTYNDTQSKKFLQGVQFNLPKPIKFEMDQHSGIVGADQPFKAEITYDNPTTGKLLINIPRQANFIIEDLPLSATGGVPNNPADMANAIQEHYKAIGKFRDFENPALDGRPEPQDGITSVTYTTQEGYKFSYWFFTYYDIENALSWGYSRLTGSVEQIAFEPNYATGLGLDEDEARHKAFAISAIKNMILPDGQIPTTDIDKNNKTYSTKTIDNKLRSAMTQIFTGEDYIIPAGGADNWAENVYKMWVPGLQCGNLQSVPPIITALSNIAEYSNIISADAVPQDGNNSGYINFTFSVVPQNPIPLLIVDNA